MEQRIAHEFPSVERIDAETLSAWLQDRSGHEDRSGHGDESSQQPPSPPPSPPLPLPLLLLDVRTAEEFRVSHLPGAIRVEPGNGVEGLPNRDLPRNLPIVTYCSVGYRSAALAQKLEAAGFTDVRNLNGSIFQWANEGRQLVNDRGEPVKTVHPYDAFWGRLLKPELRAAKP